MEPGANVSWSFTVPALPESVDTNDDFEVEFRSVDDDAAVSTVAERINLRVNTSAPTATSASITSDGVGGALDFVTVFFNGAVTCTDTAGSRELPSYDDQVGR